MKGNYAAYKQMTPAVVDLSGVSEKALAVFQQNKAREAAELRATQEKYDKYIADLTDYTETFNEADVDHYFKDEMMRVGSEIRDELYDIHVKKTQMQHYGNVNSKEYRNLILKDQELRSVPSVFKSTFSAYKNSLDEYNKGKGTKYDEQLNASSELKMLKAMNGGWTYNRNKKTFDVKDPETGDVKSLTPSQFSSSALMFNAPVGKVDLTAIGKGLIDQVGQETRSYYDEATDSQITIEKSKANGQQRKMIWEYVHNQILEVPNIKEKLHVNGKTATEYADDIMTAAGYKSDDLIKSVPKPKKNEKEIDTPDKFFENFNPSEVDWVGNAYDGDSNAFEVTTKATNAISFRGVGNVAINPSDVYIMDTSSPTYVVDPGNDKIKGRDAEGNEVVVEKRDPLTVEGRKITKLPGGIKDFTFQSAQSSTIYQGDKKYRIKFEDDNGKPWSLVLEAGKAYPKPLLEGEVKNLSLEEIGSKVVSIPPTDLKRVTDLIYANSKRVDFAVGRGLIAGKEAYIGIPITNGNEGAIKEINSTLRVGAFKNTEGFLTEWQKRYGKDAKAVPNPNPTGLEPTKTTSVLNTEVEDGDAEVIKSSISGITDDNMKRIVAFRNANADKGMTIEQAISEWKKHKNIK